MAVTLQTMPEAEYHARPELSSSQLARFMDSPRMYWLEKTGRIPRRVTEAMRFGTMAHKLILEGAAAFAKAYALADDAPVNPKTGKTYGRDSDKFQAWLAEQGRPCVTTEEYALIRAMRDAVYNHPDRPSEKGVAEAVAFGTVATMACRARIDWLEDDPRIVDVKTCADVRWFRQDCDRMHYIHRLALYRDVVAAATGGLLLPVTLVAIGKEMPHPVRVIDLGDDLLDAASAENHNTIQRILECERTGQWTTGFDKRETWGYANHDTSERAAPGQPAHEQGQDSVVRTAQDREVNAGRAVPQALDY